MIEIVKNRWSELAGGKLIVATAHLFYEVSLTGLMEIWNEFVDWRRNVIPSLREEEQLFHTSMNSKKVWVIEDGDAFTLMYPEDYYFFVSPKQFGGTRKQIRKEVKNIWMRRYEI